ncbi:MAG: hypothetical protein RSP_23600 [Rhodanobacter sp.]
MPGGGGGPPSPGRCCAPAVAARPSIRHIALRLTPCRNAGTPILPIYARRTLASQAHAVISAAQCRFHVSIDKRTLYGGCEAKMVVGSGGWRVVSQAR